MAAPSRGRRGAVRARDGADGGASRRERRREPRRARAARSVSVKDEGYASPREELRLDALRRRPRARHASPGTVKIRFLYDGNPQRQRPDHDLRVRRQRSSRAAAGDCRAPQRRRRASRARSRSPAAAGATRTRTAAGTSTACSTGEATRSPCRPKARFTTERSRDDRLAGALAAWRPSAAPQAARRCERRATDRPPTLLSAAFAPERLGAPTTVSFAVSIDPPRRSGPIPLSAVQVAYPSDLGLATSGLGLADCDPGALERAGPRSVSRGLQDGPGRRARARSPFGPQIVKETVTPRALRGALRRRLRAPRDPRPRAANRRRRIVMTGVLLPGSLRHHVPPVASLPGAPDVAAASACTPRSAAHSPTTNASTDERSPTGRAGSGCPTAARAAAGSSAPHSPSPTGSRATPGPRSRARVAPMRGEADRVSAASTLPRSRTPRQSSHRKFARARRRDCAMIPAR